MKFLIHFIFLIFILLGGAHSVLAQEITYYKVTATELNVRTGPGTGYKSLISLRKGDKVIVKQINGKWAEIIIQGKYLGYVNKNYITQIHQNPIQKEGQKKGFVQIKYFWWLIGIICVVLFLAILYERERGRCGRCHKRKAIVTTKKMIEKTPCSIDRSYKRTRPDGSKTYETYPVPGTVYTYLVTEKCKYCGDERSHFETKRERN